MPDWVADAAKVAFPVITLVLGVLLANMQERAKWRRDWTIKQVETRRRDYLDLLQGLDRLHVLTCRVRDYREGRGLEVPQDVMREAQQQWQGRLVGAGLLMEGEVQDAAHAYEAAWSKAVWALDDLHALSEVPPAFDELWRARTGVLNALNGGIDALNQEVALYMSTWWERWRGVAPPISRRFEATTEDGQP